MNATALKCLRVNFRDPAGAGTRPCAPARPRHREQAVVAPYQKGRFHGPRRRHDPTLVFNMSVFNSAKVRECIFDSLLQRENAWS
jgi:hypothetical protein